MDCARLRYWLNLVYCTNCTILAGARECNTGTGDSKASGLQHWKPKGVRDWLKLQKSVGNTGWRLITVCIQYLYHPGAA